MKLDRSRCLIFGGIVLLIGAVIAVPSIATAVQNRRLTVMLDDPNPAVRVAALRATGREGHIDLLTKGLQDEDTDVRLVAAMSLQERRADGGPSARALLIASLKDDNAGVRREADEALHRIGRTAAPALIEAMRDPDSQVRVKAARALYIVAITNYGGGPPTAAELSAAASALEKALEDEDMEVRKNAARSLEYIHRAQAGEPLYEGK